jgi:hypothetical protein
MYLMVFKHPGLRRTGFKVELPDGPMQLAQAGGGRSMFELLSIGSKGFFLREQRNCTDPPPGESIRQGSFSESLIGKL